MDFLDPKKQRSHRTRIVIGYFLIAIAVALAARLVTLTIRGFSYDEKTGQVIQNGLVFVDSQPGSARLFLDGQRDGQTSSRLVIAEGNHSIKLERDGYRAWQSSFTLLGGSIERLVYPILVPDQLSPKAVATYSAVPKLISQSPNYKRLVVQQVGSASRFDLYDLSVKKVIASAIELPAGVITKKSGTNSWQPIEWSADDNQLLLQHSYPGGTEFIVLNVAKPASSQNISKLFSASKPTKLRLNAGKVDKVLFVDKKGQLDQGAVSSKTTSVLASKVLDYQPMLDGSVALIAQNDSKITPSELRLIVGSRTYDLRGFAKSPSYQLAAYGGGGHVLVAAGLPAQHLVYVYKDPQVALKDSRVAAVAPISALKLSAKTAGYLSFSPNGRLVALQAGSRLSVYNFQDDKLANYDIKLPVTTTQKAFWLDSNHLGISTANKFSIFDFDGQNRQYLFPVANGTESWLDNKSHTLFSLAPTSAKLKHTTLQSTSLLAPADQ